MQYVIIFALVYSPCLLSSRSVRLLTRQVLLDGEKSAFDGRCEHAGVVLESDGTSVRQDIPEASPVEFGEKGVVELANILAGTGCLGSDDVAQIQRLAEDAVSISSALVLQLGATGTFAVRHRNHRLVPGEWAHVRTRGVEAKIGAKVAASRLRRCTAVSAQFQCKVSIVLMENAI